MHIYVISLCIWKVTLFPRDRCLCPASKKIICGFEINLGDAVIHRPLDIGWVNVGKCW
jgi:hypothetical protein